MRSAAVFASARTTRPDTTRLKGQAPSSFMGQFTASSTSRPRGSLCSVVNKTPLLLMSRVLPHPAEDGCPPGRTRYRASSLNGNRKLSRRSALPLVATLTSGVGVVIPYRDTIVHDWPNVRNRPFGELTAFHIRISSTLGLYVIYAGRRQASTQNRKSNEAGREPAAFLIF